MLWNDDDDVSGGDVGWWCGVEIGITGWVELFKIWWWEWFPFPDERKLSIIENVGRGDMGLLLVDGKVGKDFSCFIMKGCINCLYVPGYERGKIR